MGGVRLRRRLPSRRVHTSSQWCQALECDHRSLRAVAMEILFLVIGVPILIALVFAAWMFSH